MERKRFNQLLFWHKNIFENKIHSLDQIDKAADIDDESLYSLKELAPI